MKKKIITAMLAVSCVGLSVGSVFAADLICPKVSVQNTGTSLNVASGLVVTIKNESGAACGDLANNATRQFALNTTGTDQTYATLLTALSLQKKLYIVAVSPGVPNSLLKIAVVLN